MADVLSTHKLWEYTSAFDRTVTITRFTYTDGRATEYVFKTDSPAERAVSCTMAVSDLTDLYMTLGNEINLPDPPA